MPEKPAQKGREQKSGTEQKSGAERKTAQRDGLGTGRMNGYGYKSTWKYSGGSGIMNRNGDMEMENDVGSREDEGWL